MIFDGEVEFQRLHRDGLGVEPLGKGLADDLVGPGIDLDQNQFEVRVAGKENLFELPAAPEEGEVGETHLHPFLRLIEIRVFLLPAFPHIRDHIEVFPGHLLFVPVKVRMLLAQGEVGVTGILVGGGDGKDDLCSGDFLNFEVQLYGPAHNHLPGRAAPEEKCGEGCRQDGDESFHGRSL